MEPKLYAHFNLIPVKAWRWIDFRPEEIACSCCGAILIDDEALDRLQAVRDAPGKPVIINSAYRCEKHNNHIGGAKDSMHRHGKAFDISLHNQERVPLFKACADAGFKGFGFYDSFLHVDTGKARSWGDKWPQLANVAVYRGAK